MLLKNNESTKSYQREYRNNQERKIQKIMMEYTGLVKIDDEFETAPDVKANDPVQRQQMSLYKQICEVQNLINLKINMLLENELLSN